MKNFELKKIKCFAELSQETEAFTAELWIDGKHVADIKNDGQGGCNDITPRKPFTYNDVAEFNHLEMESKIFFMVIEYDETRKNQTKGFYLKRGDEYFTSKFPMPISKLKKHPSYNSWLLKQREIFENDGYEILNKNL